MSRPGAKARRKKSQNNRRRASPTYACFLTASNLNLPDAGKHAQMNVMLGSMLLARGLSQLFLQVLLHACCRFLGSHENNFSCTSPTSLSPSLSVSLSLCLSLFLFQPGRPETRQTPKKRTPALKQAVERLKERHEQDCCSECIDWGSPANQLRQRLPRSSKKSLLLSSAQTSNLCPSLPAAGGNK